MEGHEKAIEDVAYLRALVERTRPFFPQDRSVPGTYNWALFWVVAYLGQLIVPSAIAFGLRVPLVLAFNLPLIGVALFQGVRAARRWEIPDGPDDPRVVRRRTDHEQTMLMGRLVLLSVILTVSWYVGLAVLPHSLREADLFIPIAGGIRTMLMGVFFGRRRLLLGGWLVIAGIAAALMPFNVMLVWLALAGGTGCLVTGVLLQRELRRATPPSVDTATKAASPAG